MAEEMTALDRLSKELGGLPNNWKLRACLNWRPKTFAGVQIKCDYMDAFQAIAAIALEAREMQPTDPWAQIQRLVAWLAESNGNGSDQVAHQVMKVAEETGEVMAAYIGLVGQNPRKGVTHSRDDVAAELCDVIVTAMVALHLFCNDPATTFGTHLSSVVDRSLGKRRPTEEEGDGS